MTHQFDASWERAPSAGPDLFDQEGHLTDAAFRLLLDGALHDMGSLEVAEHLSFCDRCVQRYTQLLCGEETLPAQQPPAPLLAPPAPLEGPVIESLHRRQRRFTLQKLGSLAVAASFALVFWVGGVFTVDRLPQAGLPFAGEAPPPQQQEEQENGWFDGLGGLWDSIQGLNFNGLYAWFYGPLEK